MIELTVYSYILPLFGRTILHPKPKDFCGERAWLDLNSLALTQILLCRTSPSPSMPFTLIWYDVSMFLRQSRKMFSGIRKTTPRIQKI